MTEKNLRDWVLIALLGAVIIVVGLGFIYPQPWHTLVVALVAFLVWPVFKIVGLAKKSR